MGESIDLSELQSALECSVCLEQYENPKMLKCTHEFCKECLEQLVLFQPDGSATITCPMRCSQITTISKDTTVNDLSASYIAKNILGALKLQGESSMPVCTFTDNCTQHVSVFCCTAAMCQTCYSRHMRDKEEGCHRKFALSYDNRLGQVAIVCNEHDAHCTHMCRCNNVNKFLCRYCLQRSHVGQDGHAKTKIEDEVHVLRKAITNQLASLLDSVSTFQYFTHEAIKTSRLAFSAEITRRQTKRVKEFSDFLNKEGEQLMKEFDRIASSHLQGYETSDAVEFYQKQMCKYDVELAILKHSISKEINSDACNSTLLKKDEVLFIDAVDFRADHPLGELDVVSDVEEVVLMNSPVKSTFSCTLNVEWSNWTGESDAELLNKASNDVDSGDISCFEKMFWPKMTKNCQNFGHEIGFWSFWSFR